MIGFRVEFAEEWSTFKSAQVTPEHQIEQLWNILKTENSEIQGDRVLNFNGKVHPGLTVQVEIRGGRVFQTVTFQLINRRELVYESREIWNMWTLEEVWEHFFSRDERILPFECYVAEDRRPWAPYSRIDFVLSDSEVADTTENGSGATGGDAGDWVWLPEGPAPKGREHGKELFALSSRKGPLDGDSSGTDSDDDEEGSDIHKLAKVRHAFENLQRPVTVILKGRYEWDNGWEEVTYHRILIERTAPEDMIELLAFTNTKIWELGMMAGAVALPLPIQGLDVRREQLDIKVLKVGKGLQVVYEMMDQIWPPSTTFEWKFRAQFPDAISIVFGIYAPVSNMEISQRLRSIAASWLGEQYGPSWHACLAAQPWRTEEGEIYATVLLGTDESWNGICRIPGLPECAVPFILATAATKPEEAEIMIGYA
jgi:hypothetical protein